MGWKEKHEIAMASILEAMREGLITADELASRQGVSVRTIYRHIDRLRAVGVRVRSGPGMGYLPPRPGCATARAADE